MWKFNDITVGLGPEDIGVDTFNNTVYVANICKNSVTVIDGNPPGQKV